MGKTGPTPPGAQTKAYRGVNQERGGKKRAKKTNVLIAGKRKGGGEEREPRSTIRGGRPKYERRAKVERKGIAKKSVPARKKSEKNKGTYNNKEEGYISSGTTGEQIAGATGWLLICT